jgi:hypothetical protein
LTNEELKCDGRKRRWKCAKVAGACVIAVGKFQPSGISGEKSP